MKLNIALIQKFPFRHADPLQHSHLLIWSLRLLLIIPLLLVNCLFRMPMCFLSTDYSLTSKVVPYLSDRACHWSPNNIVTTDLPCTNLISSFISGFRAWSTHAVFLTISFHTFACNINIFGTLSSWYFCCTSLHR